MWAGDSWWMMFTKRPAVHCAASCLGAVTARTGFSDFDPTPASEYLEQHQGIAVSRGDAAER